MNIKNAQKEVDDWINAHGVRYFNELTNMAQLTEEVGEDLGEELSDVMFVVLCLANQTGIDLQEAFDKKMDKKAKRDHNRHHNNEKLK